LWHSAIHSNLASCIPESGPEVNFKDDQFDLSDATLSHEVPCDIKWTSTGFD